MRDRTLLVCAVFSLAVFVAIWAGVFAAGGFSGLDAQLSTWVYNLDFGSAGSGALSAFAVYGREYFWGLVVLLMLAFGDRETRVLAIELGVLFVVGIAAGEVLKAAIYRPRPPLSIAAVVPRIPLDPDSSFPSGHALIVSLGATFALVAFRKKWVASLLAVEAVRVCFARVFVGVHYVGDVAAGAAIGAAIVFAGIVVERRYLSGPLTRLFTRERDRVTLKASSPA